MPRGGALAAWPAAGIDWSRPWLLPYRAAGERIEAAVRAGATVAGALDGAACSAEQGHLPRFVPHAALPPGEAYEAFIRRTGQVPTRDNLHDFFNGLVWLHLPRLKARMNRLQAAEIGTRGVGAVRGALRDALTVLDENGALLAAPEPLCAGLRARDWERVFVQQRPLWREARLLLVGHALLDKLQQPRKPITAHLLPWPAAPGAPADAVPGDEAVAQRLEAALRVPRPFLPLPVLGVPGWWPGNEEAAFYDDAAVFRPPRQAQADSAGRKPSIDR